MQEINSACNIYHACNTSDLKIHRDQGRETSKKGFGLSCAFIVLKIIPVYI